MYYVGTFVNLFIVPFLAIIMMYKIFHKQVKITSGVIVKYLGGITSTLYFSLLFFIITGNSIELNYFLATIISFGFTSAVVFASEMIAKKAELTSMITDTTPKGKRIKKPWLPYIIWGLLYIVSIVFIEIIRWSRDEFNVGLTEVIFTVTSPLKGEESGVVSDAISSCIVPVLWSIIPFIAYAVIDIVKSKDIRIDLQLKKRKITFNVRSLLRKLAFGFCICVAFTSIIYSNREYKTFAYIRSQFQQTTIYEDYYVNPSDVAITAKGEPKNLIYIYLESMETTYANRVNGGAQNTNRIPNLTQLAKDNISFSNTTALGGFRSYEGTGWTMAALLSTNSGVPFAFPVARNGMGIYEEFATGLTTLGDVLEEKGYNQEFLCGSDASFAARRTFFEQHGNYKIYDLFTAREDGYIPEDYYVWWGYEDHYLYEIAKDELTKLAAEDKPFNFTMLTVDTHFPQGYECSLCTGENKIVAENVIECADRQINVFITWIQQQDFYEDTVIVIIGDHPRMDTVLVENVEYKDRTMYNCIINADVDKSSLKLTNREWSSMDVMPTVLAAMGFEIEGDRLGLGTNMFSGLETLSEQMGYEKLNAEFFKRSNYYVETFR